MSCPKEPGGGIAECLEFLRKWAGHGFRRSFLHTSREIGLDTGDLLLLYTDGLAEARAGDQLFGEDRVANTLRRDPGVSPDVLCKSLLEAARDFATEPMTDDVAILAIRRS